jgi:hypothetical protein
VVRIHSPRSNLDSTPTSFLRSILKLPIHGGLLVRHRFVRVTGTRPRSKAPTAGPVFSGK